MPGRPSHTSISRLVPRADPHQKPPEPFALAWLLISCSPLHSQETLASRSPLLHSRSALHFQLACCCLAWRCPESSTGPEQKSQLRQPLWPHCQQVQCRPAQATPTCPESTPHSELQEAAQHCSALRPVHRDSVQSIPADRPLPSSACQWLCHYWALLHQSQSRVLPQCSLVQSGCWGVAPDGLLRKSATAHASANRPRRFQSGLAAAPQTFPSGFPLNHLPAGRTRWCWCHRTGPGKMAR